MSWKVTAYCGDSCCNGKWAWQTASGHRLSPGDSYHVCAAPKNIPFGTILHVSGQWSGDVRVVDRGGAINGNRLDIFVHPHGAANNFGVKWCNVSW